MSFPLKDFADRFPQTLAQLEQGLQDRLHIGAQLYVSRESIPLANYALGESRPGIAMTPDSIQLWLSAGKPVAAVAIARLIERGLTDFDAPVARHIPEFAAGGKEAITIRHVLTHTGGFRSAYLGWPSAPWDDVIARVCAMPIEANWVPGERAGYHISTSWFILGELVRRIDGRAYGEYVRDEIFIPLEMRDAWVGMPPLQYDEYGERIGLLQNTEGGKLEPHPYANRAHVIACAPGSNAHGPAHDLGRFYEMLVGRGAWNGVRILQPETVDLLTSRQRVGMYDETFRHKIDWGLGFIVNSARYGEQTVPYGFGRHASPRTFGHGGMQCAVGFGDPEYGLAGAVILNGTPGEARHTKRIRLIMTALYEDLRIPHDP